MQRPVGEILNPPFTVMSAVYKVTIKLEFSRVYNTSKNDVDDDVVPKS